MMRVYKKCPCISEILIIDNKKDNIYVNPSWNLGVKTAKNEWLIIANDDVIIERLTELLTIIEKTTFDLIGVDISNCHTDRDIAVQQVNELYWGYGCFMIMKKSNYKPIPEQLKIWYGDNIIFSNASDPGMFSGVHVNTEMGETMRTFDTSAIEKSDTEYFKELQKMYKYIDLIQRCG